MTREQENPFEPPSTLEIDLLAAGGTAGRVDPVTSVSFRVSLDDLRRGQAPWQSPLVVVGLVLFVAMAGISLSGLPALLREGWAGASIPRVAFPLVVFAAIFVPLLVSKRGRGSARAPFETTVLLTPTELVIREERLAELRRSWGGVGPIFLNRTTLRFDFQMYDIAQGRFVMQPGQIVPLRAFESEADAASFLATARSLIESADRSTLTV